MRLPERAEDFVDETGLPFSYVIAIFEDTRGDPPGDRELAAEYWEAVGEPEFPVGTDPEQAVLEVTPFDGSPLPGKCVLSPAMEMLACEAGHEEDDWAFDIIREHASGL